jgi:hypothetical protein
MMARPTKYTPETVERICEGIRLGLTYELAAGYAGISYATFNDWREKKTQFSKAVAEAEAKGAAVNMARINKEAQEGEWRAAAWIMENRHGYARPDRKEHTGEGGGPIRIEVVYADDHD